MCARIAVARRLEVAGLVRVDDRAVLVRQVRAALELAAADHLHHQVDREVAVEARQERVAGEVDLVLVEGGVRRVPLGVRDGLGGRLVQLAEAAQLVRPTRPTARLRRLQLERQPHVVPLARSPPRSAPSRSSRGATSRSAGPRRRASSGRGGRGCARRRASPPARAGSPSRPGRARGARAASSASRRRGRSGSSRPGRRPTCGIRNMTRAARQPEWRTATLTRCR